MPGAPMGDDLSGGGALSRSWVKLSTTILDHFDLDAVDPASFKVFIKCLALACTVDDEGRLGTGAEVAYRLRVSADDLRCAIDALGGRIRETDGELWVRDWAEHQPAARKPEPAEQVTERWRRWSARQRESDGEPMQSLEASHGACTVEVVDAWDPPQRRTNGAPASALAVTKRIANDALEERRGDTEEEQEQTPDPNGDAGASRGSRDGKHADAARDPGQTAEEDALTAHAEAFAEAFHLDPSTAVKAKRTLIWGHAERCVAAGATVAEWAHWVTRKSRERTSDRRVVWGTIVKAHNATEAFLCERDAGRSDVRPRDSDGEFAEFVMR